MPDFDERAELAPRDIVARAIDHEIKRLGLDYVHLDISHREPDFVREHFPNIHARLLELGIDITREPIPVVPAAALHLRRRASSTSTAAPTCPASTRPARSPSRGCTAPTGSPPTRCSNASCSARRRRGTSSRSWDDLPPPPPIRAWDESRVTDSDEEVVIQQNWSEIRRFMWNYVGIVRTTKRLERAKHRIDLLRQEVDDYYGHFRVTPDLIELRNLLEVADLIVRSALCAPRKPRPALHARLSRDAARGRATRCWCLKRPRAPLWLVRALSFASPPATASRPFRESPRSARMGQA